MKRHVLFVFALGCAFAFLSVARQSYAAPPQPGKQKALEKLSELDTQVLVEKYKRLQMEAFEFEKEVRLLEIELRHARGDDREHLEREFAVARESLQTFEQWKEVTKHELARTIEDRVRQSQPDSDLHLFQGAWIGRDVPNGSEIRMVVSGNRAGFKNVAHNEWYEGELKIEQGTDPKRFSFVIQETSEYEFVGKTARGIYKIDDNRLIIAAAVPGSAKPPKDFEPSEDVWVIELKKE